jgi:hypothetical protein
VLEATLAERLAEAELRLAAEAGSAAVDGGAGEIRTPRSLECYELFVTTISERFRDKLGVTRQTLSLQVQ